MASKEITNSTTRNTKKGTPRDPIEETCYDHRLGIMSRSARNQPNQEKGEGDDVNIPSAIELEMTILGTLSYRLLGGEVLTSERGAKNSGPRPACVYISSSSEYTRSISKLTKSPNKKRQSQRRDQPGTVKLLRKLVVGHSIHRRRTRPAHHQTPILEKAWTIDRLTHRETPTSK